MGKDIWYKEPIKVVPEKGVARFPFKAKIKQFYVKYDIDGFHPSEIPGKYKDVITDPELPTKKKEIYIVGHQEK